MRAFAIFLAGCGLGAVPVEDPRTHALVYGLDDRQEPFATSDPVLASVADATVGLVASASLLQTAGGWTVQSTGSLAQTRDVCPHERYAQQPTAPFCSGVLVGPDQILTADSCISTSTCDATSVVFGFEMLDDTNARLALPDRDVYHCAEVTDAGTGWSLLTLDRPVVARQAATIQRGDSPTLGSDLAFAGHPAGLPMKLVDGATVRDVDADRFHANLDLYAGAHGGPVFDPATGVVEGIVTDGPDDWVWDGSCYVSAICNDSGCPELQEITSTAAFASLIAECPDGNNQLAEAVVLQTDHQAETCDGDQDWYTVAVQAGQPLQIDVLSSVDLDADLYDQGMPVGSIQTTASGLAVDYTPSGDGVISMVVRGEASGTYLIALDADRTVTTIDAPATMTAGRMGTWTVRDASPWEELVLLYGQPGTSTIPECGGRTLPLDDPWVRAVVQADGDGFAEIHRWVPHIARGRTATFYAVSRPSCRVSEPTVITFR